ncbi:hypothetical protein [Myxococcus hansupus]|nr:hypothetical protein [Myxococcus hansupus]
MTSTRTTPPLALMLSLLAAPGAALAWTPPSVPCAAATAPDHEQDSDCDGLPDHMEDLNQNGRVDIGETDPHKRDTDGDGASDLTEYLAGTDANRDAFLSFPEPMVFDLVRGLDSEKGELEFNTLFRLRPRSEGMLLQYAPEIEYAFGDGMAAELELPMENERVAALKTAVQFTFHVDPHRRWAHGIQVLAETKLHEKETDVALLHIGKVRLGERVSLVSISGVQGVHVRETGDLHAAALVNLSAFYAVAQQVIVGVETNMRLDDAMAFDWMVMPQAHVQLNHHARVQVGLGAVKGGPSNVEPMMSTRFIIEM